MSVGRKGQGGCAPPWIFIHNTDKVEGSLMVLFFGLVFSVALHHAGNFSATLLAGYNIIIND